MVTGLKNGAITYVRDLRRLTPNARKYLLGSFFIGMTFSSFMLLLNLYLREKGYGEGLIGSILSAGAIGMTLVSIPGAVLLSKVRLKPVLIVSTLLFVVFGMITIYTDTREFIWGAYFFAGIMMTFYRIASAPFFMRNSSPTERPYLFSLSFGIAVMAGFIGSLIFGQLVDFFASSFGFDPIWSHRLSMTVGVLFSLAALIPFSLLVTPKKIPTEDRLDLSRATLNRLKGITFRLSLPYFIVGTGAGMIIPFLNLFFRDRFGKSPESIGLYYGLVHLTMFIGVMAGPILVRRIGMVRTMVFTELASIPFMLILAYSYNFPLVFAAFLLRGALMNMGHPIGTNFAMEMVPKSHHGLMNALLMFAWTSSWMVSTRVGGVVIENYGYTISLLVAVVLYVISALTYYLFFRKSESFTKDGITIQTEYRMTG
jgi:predicted MFS family arabinose efflux permease